MEQMVCLLQHDEVFLSAFRASTCNCLDHFRPLQQFMKAVKRQHLVNLHWAPALGVYVDSSSAKSSHKLSGRRIFTSTSDGTVRASTSPTDCLRRHGTFGVTSYG